MKLTRKQRREAIKALRSSKEISKRRKVITYSVEAGDLVREKNLGIGIILTKVAASQGEHSAWVLFSKSGKRWAPLKTLKIISTIN